MPMQKRNDCWWFGEVGKCHNFYILIAFASVCAVTDFMSLVVLMWSGDTQAPAASDTSESTSADLWNHRCAVVAG
jgi:hypothetical protein